jgi:membrane protein DedA with SNARE-associated domain
LADGGLEPGDAFEGRRPQCVDGIGYVVAEIVLTSVGLTGQRLEKVEGFFERHGGKIVAVARFVDGLRRFNGVVAGVVNMPWWRFLAFNALGAILWSALWSGLGFVAGQHINGIYAEVERYEVYLLVALALVVALLLARWLWRRHHPVHARPVRADS